MAERNPADSREKTGESDNGEYGYLPRYYRNCDKHRAYGNCALCSKWRKLVSDHCHSTGLCRELLCRSCNVALGHFRDDPALMRRAADYVERHARQHAPYAPVRASKALSFDQVLAEYRATHPRARAPEPT